MTYRITFAEIEDILKKHNLLKEAILDGKEREVFRISYDSRDVDPGTLFVCKGVGFKDEYFYGAFETGFAGYVSEKRYDRDASGFIVTDVKKALSVISIAFYGRPSDAFTLTGITGTAGKTTTTYMLHSIFNAAAGRETGIISTNETYLGGERLEAENTTPESLKLQGFFAEAKENGLPYVTMEVSSQAYSVDRVYDQRFDVGIFMNIDLDHIGGPEHPSYEHYRDCKLEFIKNSDIMLVFAKSKEMELICKTADDSDCRVVLFDVDDGDAGSSGDRFTESGDMPQDNAKDEKKDCAETSYGPDKKILDLDEIKERINRDIFVYKTVAHKKLPEGGYEFSVNEPDGSVNTYRTNLTGDFNLVNATAAVTAARELGIAPELINKGLSDVFVPGRMNIYKKGNTTVIVDYAHNRLTLQEFLKACKKDYGDHRINVVIGAAGKNHLRRKDIGGLCSEYADYIYLTEEDSDFEDTREICEDIATYFKEGFTDYEIIEDRAEAIRKSISDSLERDSSDKPDVIAILGKGSEMFIKYKGGHRPYESDTVVVKEMLGM